MESLLSIEARITDFAQSQPNKLAVISGKERITYGRLWENILYGAEVYAKTLQLPVGTSVILAADKNVEFIYAYFGAHLAGLRAVPLAADTNMNRLQFIVDKLNAQALIGFRNRELEIAQYGWDSFAAGDNEVGAKHIDFPEMNQIADILFTTGTTGEPKGVPLTFANLAAAARNINDFIGNGADDVEVLALPISHSFGLGRLRCSLSMGATICLLGSFANVKKLFRVMSEEKATIFTMVPASYRYLKKYTGTRLGDFADQLKFIEMGSAFFASEEKRELAELLPDTRICMHYGLTEASRSAFMEFHTDSEHLSSVGKASPFTEIGIFGENGEKMPVGLEGEICVKGGHVTQGYLYRNNSDTFFGDYFRTGDWGSMDEDGYVYLKSRKKELINVGGKKVSPVEVELELKKIKGIADCACVGIDDPNDVLGEVVKAFLVRESAAVNLEFTNITKSLQGKLEGYKIPVVYEWIDKIPRTHNGKIQRLSLK